MRCFPRYLLFALTVSYLVSCMNAGPDVQTPVQEPVTYEDTVYCFNQRSVVSLEGKKGLIDTEGQVVLEPEWDSIEFLDDEVALLSRSGIWYLCTKDGRLFAETSDPGILESSFHALLAEMQDNFSLLFDVPKDADINGFLLSCGDTRLPLGGVSHIIPAKEE